MTELMSTFFRDCSFEEEDVELYSRRLREEGYDDFLFFKNEMTEPDVEQMLTDWLSDKEVGSQEEDFEGLDRI